MDDGFSRPVDPGNLAVGIALDHLPEASPLLPQLDAPLRALAELVSEPTLLVHRSGALLWVNKAARSASFSTAQLLEAARAARGGACSSLVREVVAGAEVYLVRLVPEADHSFEARLERLSAVYRLTPAQRGVLARVVKGLSNKEIAAELGCAPKTVAVHVSGLLARSGCSSRQALTAAFWQHEG